MCCDVSGRDIVLEVMFNHMQAEIDRERERDIKCEKDADYLLICPCPSLTPVPWDSLAGWVATVKEPLFPFIHRVHSCILQSLLFFYPLSHFTD